MTSKAIRFSKVGGPDVLELVSVEDKAPGPGEVAIRQQAIGVNFIDIYHRTGFYPLPLPSGIGMEGAGTVETVGEDVTYVKAGDRVAYGVGPIGGYAERVVLPVEKLIKLPDAISAESAAGMMLKGLTVQALLKQVRELKKGETILLHAAAGGVGLIMSQWASSLGATVIGVVGSLEKAELAKQHGCAHTILGRSENIAERVREITNGKGVPVVYDSVGKDTFTASLDSLAPLGMFVSFGNASGPPPAVDIGDLGKRGSLFVTRPSIMAYASNVDRMRTGAADLFSVLESGAVKPVIGRTFALADAAAAHRSLEARETTGSTVLLP
ncbi:MAG: quinone oxidoreductase [Caulobacterales bacterium]